MASQEVVGSGSVGQHIDYTLTGGWAVTLSNEWGPEYPCSVKMEDQWVEKLEGVDISYGVEFNAEVGVSRITSVDLII